jgi:c-di-GMP-binding flagellar brake protein YcgR
MSSFLYPAQAVAVEVRNRTYLTAVLDVREGAEVSVRAPDNGGQPLSPPANAPVRLVVQEEKQAMTFFTRVLRMELRADGLSALVLAWPEAAERARRRRHVRVDVMVKAEATPQPRAGEPTRPVNALTMDLSEGGVRLTVAKPVEIGALVHLRMHVRQNEVIECAGRVVRAGATEQMLAPHAHWIAIEFTDLPEATRQEIVRHR